MTVQIKYMYFASYKKNKKKTLYITLSYTVTFAMQATVGVITKAYYDSSNCSLIQSMLKESY